MKLKLGLTLAFACIVCAASCGLAGSGPSAKVKEFVNLAVKRDSEATLKLMPRGEGDGSAARLRNSRTLSGDSDLIAVVGEGVKSIDILKETINDKAATVETSVLGVTYAKPVIYRFQLQNENGEWKVSSWRRVDNSR
jgi:hypothetical protein